MKKMLFTAIFAVCCFTHCVAQPILHITPTNVWWTNVRGTSVLQKTSSLVLPCWTNVVQCTNTGTKVSVSNTNCGHFRLLVSEQPNFAYEGLVGTDTNHAVDARFADVLYTALNDLNWLGDMFILSNQSRVYSQYTPNVLTATNTSLLGRYLDWEFGQPPVATYLLLDRSPLPALQFTASMRPTFFFLDGRNANSNDLRLIEGVAGKCQRTRDECLTNGVTLAKVAFFWQGMPANMFGSSQHIEFTTKLLDATFIGDWILGPLIFEDAVASASILDAGGINPVAQYLRWRGCLEFSILEWDGLLPYYSP